MARIIKCDRCGAVVSDPSEGFFTTFYEIRLTVVEAEKDRVINKAKHQFCAICADDANAIMNKAIADAIAKEKEGSK